MEARQVLLRRGLKWCKIFLLLVSSTLPLSAQWSADIPATLCGSDSSLYSVTFSNQDHAFTVGEDGAAFRSSNGGTTFQPMTVAGTTDLYEIRFPSPMNGYICGDSGTIARSSDGGESWIVEHLLSY